MSCFWLCRCLSDVVHFDYLLEDELGCIYDFTAINRYSKRCWRKMVFIHARLDETRLRAKETNRCLLARLTVSCWLPMYVGW